MSVIDDFLKDTTPENRIALNHVRDIVHSHVEEVDEVISYAMPGFRMRSTGKIVLGFNINKHSLAIYPHSGQTLDSMNSDLSKWRSALSALNFTPSDPIPDTIIKELLDVRLKEIHEGYGSKKR